jgi:hypothetical protein
MPDPGVVSAAPHRSSESPGCSKLAPIVLLAAVTLSGWMHPAPLLGTPTITYIQSNYAEPQSPQSSVGVAFSSAQNAGDLNVIVVGWADTTATVNGVRDTLGNTYLRAIGPTQLSGTLSQSIYYAKNIKAGTNAVTVTFSTAAVYPDIRIFEYRGADPNNPVDVTAAGSSTSSSSSSTGYATTTAASDLIFGANRVGIGMTTGPGSGFIQRQLTPTDGDIAEDETAATTGKYKATAYLNSTSNWVMQMVAFRAAPSISSISYMQGNYAEPPSAQTVTVPFATAQTAGDLNVIVVGWADTTATVSAVADHSGNSYALAVGPTSLNGSLSQSIYYAKKITAAAAGANAVTVTFSTTAAYPDIRIFEYSGADQANPVDVTAAGSSTSSSLSATSFVTTTAASDLIFGANRVGIGMTTGPGSGFIQRQLTPTDGDIAEDETAATTGSYRATAYLNTASNWIMQMVAFRAPSATASDSSLAASPTSVNFGSVTVDANSSKTVNLTNTGAVSVTVSQGTATESGFSISGLSLPLTLAPSQSASFTASFSPAAAGSFSGSISIISTASNSPMTIPLSGTGATQTISALSASPGSLSFGNVTVSSRSTLPVVVTNTGNTSVTVSQATTTGAGFSSSGPSLPFTLAAGQNASFSVTFGPTAAGSATGSLSIVSNATNSPTVSSLSGMGVNQHTVTLTWVASTSPNITGYDVYRGDASGGPYTKLDSSPVTGTAYTDTTVEAGQTYYYVTTAVNSQGVQSSDSNQATAVVPSP